MERDPKFENVTFTITCTMRRRWAAQFLGMLKYMQFLGSAGASRNVGMFADGDGDYLPTFEFEVPEGVAPAFVGADLHLGQIRMLLTELTHQAEKLGGRKSIIETLGARERWTRTPSGISRYSAN